MKTYLGLSIRRILGHRLRTYWRVARYYQLHQIPNDDAIKKTKDLWGSKAGRRTFVFGNGPSMNKLDPRKVRRYQGEGFDVITVNNFLSSEMGKHIYPDYHVFSDPLDFEEVGADHPRKERAERGKRDKAAVMERGIPLFVPVHFRRLDPYDRSLYFCDVENIFSDNVADILKPRGYLSWTGMKALAIACYLGYERIHICGMDYDMFRKLQVDENNRSYWIVEHFYDDEESPSYIIGKSRYSSGEVLYFAHLNLVCHEKFKGFPITNLDQQGLIDSFSKQHNLDVYKSQ